MTEIRHEGFYHHLIPELARRSARAFISSLDPASAPLRRALFELFEKPPNQGESFVGDPVFEAAFGWETAATTLGDLAGELLHSTLVDALDAPPSEFKDQRLPRTLKPYKHQIESWRALAQEPPRSIVVSSGTGSGKTECFAIPLFNDLLVQADRQGSRPLVGVRALMLYPLNALIANQRDRFRAWLHTLAGRVRFGLYNGHTPEDMPAGARRHEEARSRKEIRDAPPPLLVTNPTMLEYMLVRSEDRPIIAASRGKLRWIVLDEAHTYVGSQAAEIALLLRRVLHAFEVDATDVRFIATSATISSGADASSREALQRFLADLAGVSTARVSIIEGRRRKPSLTTGGASEGNETISVPSSLPEDLGDLEDLPQGDPLELFDRLKASAEACALRDALLEGPKTLSHLAALQGATQARPAEGRDPRVADERTLRLLDIATQARHDGEAFLPLRGHVFHRTQRGLWACVNPACPGKKGTPLDDPAWSFGSLHTARRATCPHCDALVAELVLCRSCGKEYLLVSEEVQADGSILCARSYETEVEAEDLFVDAETSVASDDDSETSDDVSKETALAETSLAEPGQDPVPRTRPVQVKRSLGRLVAPRDLPDLRYITLDLKTGYLDSLKGVPIALVPPEEDGLFHCRVCGVADRGAGEMLRPTSAGAPFFLSVSIPALLEHLRPERHGDAWVPHEGRRAISFTDSRQGTARFALRSQIDAERAFVRSWLYHRLWDKAQVAAAATPDTETIEKKSQQLKTLESLPPDSGMDDLIEGLRADIAKATQIVPGVLSWSDAVLGLTACDEVKAMMRQWQERLAVEFDARQVAELLLYREVLRRLRRQRGLEGLGLLALTYEGLDRIKQVPASWRRRGQDVDSWRVFLRLLLDFFVRDRACLLVSDDEVRWLGVPWRARYLVGPDATHLQRNQVRWPRVPKGARRPSRMVTYLARVFGLDLKDRAAAADVDAIFVDAWDALRAKGFLEHPGDAGYQFNFKNQVAFTTISQGVVCPLTRSVLAEVLGNLTPYLTADTDDVHSRCTPITLPKLPFPFGGDAKTPSDRREHLMAWLETESSVRSAREAGIWTEFSDRIASNAAYFSVGEHSAQQTALVLRRFEDDFKAGKLNLLSCSTTMELGVDIGGLSAVAMNNAPPGPANFLQRAGRAGRRGETTAVSLTLCKSVPHGEAVFRDPLWPFVTPIHVPQVSLSSEPIVSRHVGALLLTRFLTLGEKRKRARSMLTLSCGHFFVALAKRPAPVARFKDWLDAEAPQDPWIVKGMKRLVAGTLLSGRAIQEVFRDMRRKMDAIESAWRQEYDALLAELEDAGGAKGQGASSPAQLAIERQLYRLKKEYLLKELTARAFLPGHGFPTDVVPFVTTTIEDLQREERSRRRAMKRDDDLGGSTTRDPTPGRYRDYPSRNRAQAIRDYAPGMAVVVNGKVFESEGVTLNWHLPPKDDLPTEVQAFRWAFRCPRCGASDTQTTQPKRCPRCGEALGGRDRLHYLEPAGFAVRIGARPKNTLPTHDYVRPLPPWISAGNAPWVGLSLPDLGCLRSTAKGHLFHQSRGAHGHGWAICLRCGLADHETVNPSEVQEDNLPPKLRHHRPLRGGRARNEKAECTGNDHPFALRRHQYLGASVSTDVVELALGNAKDGRPADKIQALSIAVALRQALAEDLGIDDREVGYGTRPDHSLGEEPAWMVLLYDKATGGAGYVTQVPERLPTLLARARDILLCKERHCDAACHGCLLNYDTQYEMASLDRHRALELLDETYLSRLDPRALPEDLWLFGSSPEDQRLVLVDLPSAIRQAVDRAEAPRRLILALGLRETPFAPELWPLWEELERFATLGVQVDLIVDGETVASGDADNDALTPGDDDAIADLRRRASDHGATLKEGVLPATSLGEGIVLAELLCEGGTRYRWASPSAAAAAVGETWGSDGAERRVVAETLGG